MKRPRKHVGKIDEHVSYVVRITGWDRWWSFNVGDGSRWEPGPYNTGSTLTLRGEIFRPESFKYPRAEITLSGRNQMMEEEGDPKFIGSIDVKNDLLRPYLFVPMENMQELTSVATSDRLAVIHISGTPLRYRRRTARGISLSTEFDPEEW